MEAEQSKHDGSESLPEDIVFDVLARLPAKPLCRFRCVCKGWRALISDPTFVAAQRSRAGPHLVGVFFGVGRRPPDVRVMDMDGNVVRVLEVHLLAKDYGDVLGVLQPAACHHHATRHHVCSRTTVAVCCDTCRAGAMIIDLAAGRACAVGMDTSMAALSSIGRAALSGAFKVICLDETSPYCWICKVATIGGAEPLTWRTRSPPPFAFSWHSGKRATVNGIIYFMAHFNKHDAASDSGPGRIAAFDLDSEEWKMINGPTLGIQENIWYLNLTELKGCLGVVQFQGHSPIRFVPYDDDCCAVMWLLIDPNKSMWVKDCTIQMPKTWVLTKQLWALDDGRILLLVREFLKKVISKQNEISYLHHEVLVFYNPSTKTFTKFREIEIPVWFYDKFVLYTGSFLS